MVLVRVLAGYLSVCLYFPFFFVAFCCYSAYHILTFFPPAGLGMSAQLICASRHARSSARGSNLIFVKSCATTPLRVPRQFTTRGFSSTPRAMTATKIDGTAIAKSIRERIAGEIKQKQENNPRYKPSLTIVQGMLY